LRTICSGLCLRPFIGVPPCPSGRWWNPHITWTSSPGSGHGDDDRGAEQHGCRRGRDVASKRHPAARLFARIGGDRVWSSSSAGRRCHLLPVASIPHAFRVVPTDSAGQEDSGSGLQLQALLHEGRRAARICRWSTPLVRHSTRLPPLRWVAMPSGSLKPLLGSARPAVRRRSWRSSASAPNWLRTKQQSAVEERGRERLKKRPPETNRAQQAQACWAQLSWRLG